MQKDSILYGGWEHRDLHKINSMLFVSVACFKIEVLEINFSLIKLGRLYTSDQIRQRGHSF